MKQNKEEILEEIYRLCNKTPLYREIPKEADRIAKENGFVVLVGGSDDLMYALGADCVLTKIQEIGCFDGTDFQDIRNKELKEYAKKIDLKVWWCGAIYGEDDNIIEKRDNYEKYSNIDKQGSFSFSTRKDILQKDFLVMEDEDNVYCTGLIFFSGE